MRLSREEFEAVVREAVSSLPPVVRETLEGVVLLVQDLPDARQMRDNDIDDPMALFGLYEGIDVGNKSVQHSLTMPDRITIFQKPLEGACRTPQELIEEIQDTVLHEIGHHLGFDEEGLDDMGIG